MLDAWSQCDHKDFQNTNSWKISISYFVFNPIEMVFGWHISSMYTACIFQWAMDKAIEVALDGIIESLCDLPSPISIVHYIWCMSSYIQFLQSWKISKQQLKYAFLYWGVSLNVTWRMHTPRCTILTHLIRDDAIWRADENIQQKTLVICKWNQEKETILHHEVLEIHICIQSSIIIFCRELKEH